MEPRTPTIRRVLVTGACGNVGREVVRAVAARGLIARAGERSIDRARSVLGPEVERVWLDFREPRTFGPATEGCDALFLLRPPAIADVVDTVNRLADVALHSGVKHVVFLSVAGAERNAFIPHHTVEQHLRRVTDAWTFLRPGFFAQNLGDAYRTDIVADHRLFVPAGQARVAFVDVRDVADVAATIFADPAPHRQQAYTLTGPQAVDFATAARVLAEKLGRPVRYEPTSACGYIRHLHRRGLPLGQNAVQTLLHIGLRYGQAERVDPTLEQLLGRPPRALDRYVADHVELWQGPAPAAY